MKLQAHWWSAPWLKRLASNSGWGFGGSVLFSAASLVAMVFAARLLGPEDFGRFAMITSYAAVIDGLLNFQSWQALIRFGSVELKERGTEAFRGMVKFGFALDAGCAVLATLAAVTLVPVLASAIKWDADSTRLAAFYSVVILSRILGTPTAILRLFDRFDIVARQQWLFGCFRIALIGIASLLLPTLPGLLAAWGLAEVLGNMILVAYSWGELRRQGYADVWSASIRAFTVRHKRIWAFLWATNVHASIKVCIKEADIVVLGALSSTSDAGIFRVVKQIAGVAGKATGPLYQAVYPQLADAALAGDKATFKDICIRPALLVAIVYLIGLLAFAMAGRWLLLAVLGPQYVEAYSATIIYLVGSLLAAATFTLHPAILALGRPRDSLVVLVLSTMVYSIVFFLLVPRVGLIGASGAYVIFYLLWTTLMIQRVRSACDRMPQLAGRPELLRETVGANSESER